MMPNPRAIFRSPSPRTGRRTAGGMAGQRAALGLALASMLSVVMPLSVTASSPGVGVEAMPCTSCTARRQAFQRARQANLQEGCGPGDLAISGTGPCPLRDTTPPIGLPSPPNKNSADALQRPAGHNTAGPE